MTTPCRDIELFVDGELDPAAAESFRNHLLTCDRCQAELGELLQLAAFADRYHHRARSREEPVPAGALVHLRARLRWAIAGGGLSLAAAAVIAFLVISYSHAVPKSVWAPGETARLIEGRSSCPLADGYLPLVSPELGGPSNKAPPLPLSHLAHLSGIELASAYLVRGDPGMVSEAVKALNPLEKSVEVENELALACLVRADAKQNDYEEALRHTESALEKNPKHGPALFNKALALRALELKLLAARTFQAVAEFHEPGWSDEAGITERQLRDATLRVRDRWYAARHDGEQLLASGTPPSRDVLKVPILRLYFYDAVRTRTSASEVQSLMQLAHDLDALSDGTALQDYVRIVARRDFSARAPLARRYLEFITHRDAAEGSRLLSDLSHSSEDDILVGMLVQADAPFGGPRERAIFQRRAPGVVDPWFDALLLQREAAATDDLPGAKQKLEQALAVCQHPGLEFRCLDVERDLTRVLLRLSDPKKAYGHASKGWALAQRSNEWGMELVFIDELAQLARIRDDFPLARAYAEEVIERAHLVGDKPQEIFLRQNLALAEMGRLHVDAAREQIDKAIATGRLGILGAMALADIARHHREAGDAAAMDAFRETLSGMSPGKRALATHALGRFEIETHPIEGRRLLEDAIDQANKIGTTDDDASAARLYSYTSLILASGHDGDFASAWTRVKEEAGGALPERCTVAAAVDGERTLIVARSASGAVDGAYSADRTSPLPERVDGLVPEHVLAALRGCAEVQVVAHAPLYGRAGLLPREFAWGYILPTSGHELLSPAQAGAPGTHLIVQSATLSDERRDLPRIPPWVPERGQDEHDAILSGAEATPSAVLRDMEDASAIDIVAHGLVDPVSDEAYLALAPDQEGDALRASRIERAVLRRRPVVVLASCHAAHAGPQLDSPRGLPAAFLRAGARAVLAATSEIPADEGPDFFSRVRGLIEAGTTPAIALRDERESWLAQGRGKGWLGSVLLFE